MSMRTDSAVEKLPSIAPDASNSSDSDAGFIASVAPIALPISLTEPPSTRKRRPFRSASDAIGRRAFS